MSPFSVGFAILIAGILLTGISCEKPADNKVPVTPKVYSKLLRTRRKEHNLLIQTMLKAEYAKNYKLISMAMEKIFQYIAQSNQTLSQHNYTSSEGFPTEQGKQQAVMLVLENSCLAADIILHFPEISYRILDKVPNWRGTINWCIDFVNSFPHITDMLIVELMNLAYQEINENARSPDFINPYYEKVDTIDSAVKKKSKPRKKIKKGPRLTTRTEL